MSRHIEHSELTEETLNDRAFYKAERIEDIVSESIEYKQLHRAVSELKPVVGSEQGGIRPVLIISNDIGNSHSPTVIIAAITGKTQTKAKLPTHTEVKDVEGLDRDSIILLEQIRTIDKRRLREYMEFLTSVFFLQWTKCWQLALA